MPPLARRAVMSAETKADAGGYGVIMFWTK